MGFVFLKFIYKAFCFYCYYYCVLIISAPWDVLGDVVNIAFICVNPPPQTNNQL